MLKSRHWIGFSSYRTFFPKKVNMGVNCGSCYLVAELIKMFKHHKMWTTGCRMLLLHFSWLEQCIFVVADSMDRFLSFRVLKSLIWATYVHWKTFTHTINYFVCFVRAAALKNTSKIHFSGKNKNNNIRKINVFLQPQTHSQIKKKTLIKPGVRLLPNACSKWFLGFLLI